MTPNQEVRTCGVVESDYLLLSASVQIVVNVTVHMIPGFSQPDLTVLKKSTNFAESCCIQ